MTYEYDSRLSSVERALQAETAAHQQTMTEVRRVAHSVERVSDGLTAFRTEFKEFVEQDRLARDMQFAETALIDVRAQRDRHFGHYETVRRGTIGTLQAMDARIVTESSLLRVAEELMIQTPGYWLAPAQVALAAWITDAEAPAKRALLAAMNRDPNKTALFFSLVLARQRRYDATAKWMYEYVGRQDPMMLSREFTVVLDAAAQGALGGRAMQLVKERCITWYEQLRSAEDMVEEQSLRWQRRISRNQLKLSAQFGTLAMLCPDWESLAGWLDAATAHERTERWLRELLEPTIVKQASLPQRVDPLLRNLVTAYDEDEDSLRQEELKWASIVKHGGDHAAAAREDDSPAKKENSPAPESRTDFLTLLTTIGIAPEQASASPITRQLAVRMANKWIASAAHKISNKSRADRPRSVRVGIGSWSGELSPVDSNDETIASFERFVDREVGNEIKVMGTVKQASASTIALVVFGILLYEMISNNLVLAVEVPVLAVAFLVAAGCLNWLRLARQALPQRREEARRRGEKRKDAGQHSLHDAIEEVHGLFHQWEIELTKEGSLIDFLNKQAAYTYPLPDLDYETDQPGRFDRQAHDAEEAARRAEPRSGDGRSYAASLPQWDLLPPPPRADGTPIL
jgi:hypothetical protein